MLNTYWAGKPIPVDPMQIARDAGLVVVEVKPSDVSDLGDASGMYDNESGVPRILYRSIEYPPRQRFTVAHELGHHFLNHGKRFRDGASTLNDPYDAMEISANRFAAELLMPLHAVKTLVEERNVESVTALANAFGVSEPAMRIRLKNLGYIQ